MELIEKILSEDSIDEAIEKVVSNKGAAGVDSMTTAEVESYYFTHGFEIITQIKNKIYNPLPVRRVYIPKPNGKKRPLGIPAVKDRVIQQSLACALSDIYEPHFSDYSYGFRKGRSQHDAMNKVLEYLNDGYQWVIDLDIEKYFDTVNHDKLVSILRERVKDDITLHLIRSILKSGIMEDGLVSPSEEGVPQGSPVSCVLSNIYLDKFDKELEARGLRFVRFADDVNIFVKSEMSAERVMKSISSWLERKLFLKVSATKTKVVRPKDSNFLGFTFVKSKDGWKCKPMDDRKKRLYSKCRAVLIRRKAVAVPLSVTFKRVNEIVRGWINYFRISSMKMFMKEFGEWLRHKIRVIILKQWKKPLRIYKNLMYMNKKQRCGFSHEDIFKVANSRKGLYARANGDVVNFILSPKILAIKSGDRPGLVNPLEYYLG
ncbi:MAG: group II intron reverse transcriptase/maturase [Solobacterium sp.]|nr:group II intron reverse transcriptase/maturase [Solobacterium sp.]